MNIRYQAQAIQPTLQPKNHLSFYGSLLSAVCVIHPDPSSLVFFPINRADHLRGYLTVNLYPAIHFLHINFPEDFFSQIAHVQNKLQKTRFVKSVFCTQVHKQPHVITITGKFPFPWLSSPHWLPFPPYAAEIP